MPNWRRIDAIMWAVAITLGFALVVLAVWLLVLDPLFLRPCREAPSTTVCQLVFGPPSN